MAAPDHALDSVISACWRLALIAKAVLLLAISAGFGWLAFNAIDDVSLRLGRYSGVIVRRPVAIRPTA